MRFYMCRTMTHADSIILALGDSLVAGYGLAQEDGLAALL